MWKETEHFSSCRVKKHPNSTQAGLISCGNHPFLKVGHTKKSFFPSFHFGVGKQLCAGREHPALTWVDNTVPGSEGHRFLPPPAKWDLFIIFFPIAPALFYSQPSPPSQGLAGVRRPSSIPVGSQHHNWWHFGSLSHPWTPSGQSFGARGHPWDSHGAP